MSTDVYNRHLWRSYVSIDPCTKEEQPVTINCTQVCCIKRSPSGKTVVSMVNGDTFLLTEPFEEVDRTITGTFYN